MTFSRRQLLKLGGCGLVAGTLGAHVVPGFGGTALAQTAGFPTPPEQDGRSDSGIVTFTLEATPVAVEVAGRRAGLWTYNGSFPGPTLRLREGDRVRIQFTNALPEPTNLHFHGLRIPPTGSGDDVFKEVAPGETTHYAFTIPPDSAGTYWYHPHLHGAVASQLFRGLAGAIIVEGALDAAFSDIPEQLVVLRDFEIGADGEVSEPTMMDSMLGREGSLLTANGATSPTLDVPTAVVRLRLLNAANARYFRLVVPGATLNVIATDGGFVSAPYEVSELLMAPGERYDVVARFPRRGRYELMTLPYDRAPEMSMEGVGGMPGGAGSPPGGGATPGHTMGGHGMGGVTGGSGGGASVGTTGVSEPTPLMRFDVGEPASYHLPVRLAAIAALSPEDATGRRRIVLSEDMAAMRFFIDGKAFNHERTDFAPRLGTVEHWEIVNEAEMDHPMHLHVHPFQVLSRDGVPERVRAWKDVVNVPAGGRVELLVPFDDHAGRTVFHCHIVEHEDLGMMSVVEVTA